MTMYTGLRQQFENVFELAQKNHLPSPINPSPFNMSPDDAVIINASRIIQSERLRAESGIEADPEDNADYFSFFQKIGNSTVVFSFLSNGVLLIEDWKQEQGTEYFHVKRAFCAYLQLQELEIPVFSENEYSQESYPGEALLNIEDAGVEFLATLIDKNPGKVSQALNSALACLPQGANLDEMLWYNPQFLNQLSEKLGVDINEAVVSDLLDQIDGWLDLQRQLTIEKVRLILQAKEDGVRDVLKEKERVEANQDIDSLKAVEKALSSITLIRKNAAIRYILGLVSEGLASGNIKPYSLLPHYLGA